MFHVERRGPRSDRSARPPGAPAPPRCARRARADRFARGGGRPGMRGAATRVRSGAARLRTLGQAAPRPGWPVRARRAGGCGRARLRARLRGGAGRPCCGRARDPLSTVRDAFAHSGAPRSPVFHVEPWGPLARTAPRGRPAPPLRRGVLGAPGLTGPRAEDGRAGRRGGATRVRSSAARLRTLGQAPPRPGSPVRARRAVDAGGRACARGFAVAPGGLALGARAPRPSSGPTRPDAERGPGAPPDGARAGAPPELTRFARVTVSTCAEAAV